MAAETEYVIKESLSDIVVECITSKVFSGEWSPGMKLPSERKLADTFGVSRTVLREALTDKRVTRLIDIDNGFKYVKSFSLGELIASMIGSVSLDNKAIDEIMEVRTIVEEYNARKAAVTISEEQISYLQENINTMSELLKEGKDASSLESKFHYCLAEATGNSLILNFYKMFENVLKGTYSMSWQAVEVSGTDNTTVSEHQAILNAIKRRDSFEAGQRMAMHISVASDRIKTTI